MRSERVVLRIGGLKCGCCEGGISRAVRRICAIKNHQLNIVLSRLEFDLDTRKSVSEVIGELNTKTGCIFDQHIVSPNQTLDVYVTDVTRIKYAGQPFGVIDLEAPIDRSWEFLQSPKTGSAWWSKVLIGKTNLTRKPPDVDVNLTKGEMTGSFGRVPPPIDSALARIHYNATLIGAKDIFEYYRRFDSNLELAPPSARPRFGFEQTLPALFLFLASLCFTGPVLVFAWAIDHDKLVYAHVSFGLATIVQLIAFKEFVPNAARTLYHSHTFDMDFLVAISTAVAYIFSVVSYIYQLKGTPLETGCFFETSTLLVTMILLGRFINEVARYKATKSVSFRALQIDEALLIEADPNSSTLMISDSKSKKIDARLLQYGDHFKVPPHTRVVTDGVVVCGGSEIDESMITGESIPVAKGVHSTVYAGTNNGSGTLIVRLTVLPHENSVQKIAAMIENAELTKPKVQALADRIAGLFVPAIAIVGIAVFLIWLFLERYHVKHVWKNAVVTAATYAIATLVVSCPCAIGLAVPMVVLIASGVAARFGIIFRDPQKLEVARNVTDIIFDKTGTLTCGIPTVWEDHFDGGDAKRIKGLLLSLLKHIQHPVSASVLRHLEKDMRMDLEANIRPPEVVNITSIPGEGVIGICKEDGLEIRAGNPAWLDVELPRQSSTILCVKVGGVLVATFKLVDRARHTAELVVEKLQARHIAVHMISGDNQGAVDETAFTLNIPKRNTKASCKPEGKMNYVKDLQQLGKVVMFVGDGTNDSVALKQANVGVHINQGSDIAKSAADVVLMTTRLHDVLIMLDISRAAYRRIVVNFTWSAFYNVFAILLASGAFVTVGEHFRIKPQCAGLGELVSVLPVILIAFQMKWCNYGKQYRQIEYDYMRSEPPKIARLRKRVRVASSEDAGCWNASPAKRPDTKRKDPKERTYSAGN